jgi:hypothetical protein
MSYRVFVFASSLKGTPRFQYPGVDCLTEFLCLLQVLEGTTRFQYPGVECLTEFLCLLQDGTTIGPLVPDKVKEECVNHVG